MHGDLADQANSALQRVSSNGEDLAHLTSACDPRIIRPALALRTPTLFAGVVLAALGVGKEGPAHSAGHGAWHWCVSAALCADGGPLVSRHMRL